MPLIWFEGGDGTGKGTQLKMTSKRLEELGYMVHIYREPGGDEVGELLRSLLKADESDVNFRVLQALLDPQQSYNIQPRTEVLLFCAVRTQLERLVMPWLDEGCFVLADRSWVSTMAYQVHGRNLVEDADMIRTICRWAMGSLLPDLVIVYDITNEEAERRRGGRGTTDRFEAEGDSFQKLVMAGYRIEAIASGYHLVDASSPPNEVFDQSTWALVEPLLPEEAS